MKRQLTLIVSALALWTGMASCQEPARPPSADKAKDTAAGNKPLAYLIVVQKVQEGSPDVSRSARGNALPGRRTAKQLEDLGFKTREVAAFSPQLTMDYLKQFNVVVLGAGGEGNQHCLLSPLADEKAKLILDYVKEGGGLLMLRTPGWQFGKDIEEYNRWLAPAGAQILDEQVADEENAVKLPSGWTVFWTDNIVRHPVTQGVAGLFYPDVEGSYARYTDFTSPVKAGDEWTVLVSGKKTSQTTHRKKGGVLQPPVPGTHKTAPPILAVREFGKGRIAVFPLASSCIWQDSYHVFWGEGLVADGQTKGMKGGGAQLLANLFTYLSAPSQGRFGGYRSPRPPEEPYDAAKRVIDWDAMRIEGRQRERCFVGLVGAQSALSSGRGEPVEFIKAAQAAKYDFIVFAEQLERMTPEKFTLLKQSCEQNSGKAFKAYPGFAYLDSSGNSWVAFSDKLSYPKPEWFSSGHPGCISSNNALMRGAGNPSIILTRSHQNPEPPWLQGNFNGFALFTYENGQLMDDSVDQYLRLMRSSFGATPVVVRFVSSPDQVGRNRKSGFQTYVRWFDDNLVEAFTDFSPKHKGSPVHIRSSFVSEGPVIEDMRIANWGVTDLAQTGASRCRLHIMVSAPDGLKEIRILDGDRTEPWRRFLPGGKKTWEQTIDFYHDRQHDLVASITDENGRRAIGWNNPTRVQENSFLRCSDNFNTMPRGKWWGEPEDLLNIRGFEEYLVCRNFLYCGTLALAGMDETKRPAIGYYPVLASRFGSIVDTIVDWHYPVDAPGNPDQTDVPFRAGKNEHVAGKTRYTYYTCRQESSLVEHVQGEFGVLEDFTSKQAIVFHAPSGRGSLGFCAARRDGQFFSGILSRRARHFEGDLPDCGYAALFPNPFAGSVGMIPLQEGLSYTCHTDPDATYGNIYLRLPPNKTEFKRGETIRYEYLGVVGALGGMPDNGFVNEIIHSMGLKGAPACAIAPAKGSVESRRLVTSLKSEGHGFSAKVKQTHLPLDLPVRISGLNPRWDAGVVYQGEATLVLPEWVIDEFNQRYVVRRERKVKDEILRFPVLEDGTGFLQLDTEAGDKAVYIGNLLVSDDPGVCLVLTDTRPGKCAFVVHNPKDRPVTCRIAPGPGFQLLGEFSKEVTVPAGTSLAVKTGGE